MDKGHDDDLESEEFGFVGSQSTHDYEEEYGPKYNWGVSLLMGFIGFEVCIILHILYDQPQSYLIYIIRLIGIAFMMKYTMTYTMNYLLMMIPDNQEDKNDIKCFLAYIATSAAFFTYEVVVFLFHPKWLLTNLMNNSLEINYLKIYPHLMLCSWILLRQIRKHSYQQRKGLHYY